MRRPYHGREARRRESRARVLVAAGGPRSGTRDARAATGVTLSAEPTARRPTRALDVSGDTASQRVAERSGFRREGVLRSYHVVDGRREDAVFFSLLPGDLDERAARDPASAAVNG
jgi:hypothetical protein